MWSGLKFLREFEACAGRYAYFKKFKGRPIREAIKAAESEDLRWLTDVLRWDACSAEARSNSAAAPCNSLYPGLDVVDFTGADLRWLRDFSLGCMDRTEPKVLRKLERLWVKALRQLEGHKREYLAQ